jgi:hypothetical protein
VSPEKFEDKDTDALTGRMQPLSEVLEELGVETTREAIIDELVAKNVEATIGADADITREEWSAEEQAFIETLAPTSSRTRGSTAFPRPGCATTSTTSSCSASRVQGM